MYHRKKQDRSGCIRVVVCLKKAGNVCKKWIIEIPNDPWIHRFLTLESNNQYAWIKKISLLFRKSISSRGHTLSFDDWMAKWALLDFLCPPNPWSEYWVISSSSSWEVTWPNSRVTVVQARGWSTPVSLFCVSPKQPHFSCGPILFWTKSDLHELLPSSLSHFLLLLCFDSMDDWKAILRRLSTSIIYDKSSSHHHCRKCQWKIIQMKEDTLKTLFMYPMWHAANTQIT